jgi:hypothetical protein
METVYKNLEVFVDLNPKTKFLTVKGNVLLYPQVDNIKLVKANPQGFNETELILLLKYTVKNPAMKGVYYPIYFKEMLFVDKQYTSVRIIHESFDEQSFILKFITADNFNIEQFLNLYKFQFTEINSNNLKYEIITEIINLKDNKVIDNVRTTININEANIWISDSQTEFSIISWDWNKLIEQTKRNHLDFFAQRVPIIDFFPLNIETDISFINS